MNSKTEVIDILMPLDLESGTKYLLATGFNIVSKCDFIMDDYTTCETLFVFERDSIKFFYSSYSNKSRKDIRWR